MGGDVTEPGQTQALLGLGFQIRFDGPGADEHGDRCEHDEDQDHPGDEGRP